VTDEKTGKNEHGESPAEQVLAVGKTAVETAQEAIAKAQETIEKIQSEGNKILESLLKESSKMLGETHKMAGGKVEEMKSRVEEARGKAAETVDNLEQIFEERVSRALNRLGIPTSDDFQAIATRLEDLNKNVQVLIESKQSMSSKPAPSVGGEDDLQAISGLGPVLASKLNANGLMTYKQLAQLSDEEVERIETDVIHSSGRFDRENWIGQAKELHLKKYGERL
jgi:poly(hydroxyalkanoate) granule-associated protein